MTGQEEHRQREAYFNSRYDVVWREPFVRPDRTRLLLRDHGPEEDRRCRFCGRGRPEVTFKKEAHAAPDFLGNLSIFSSNECDACNARFGLGCEDHLSKRTLLARTLMGIPRKKGRASTFKSRDESLRIDAAAPHVDIQVPAPHTLDDFLVGGRPPDDFVLPGDTGSQPHVPILAAQALVKIACSVCPKEDLGQCRAAIGWLQGRVPIEFSQFPVLEAFTPGWIGDAASEVAVLRRRGDGAEPYLWCLVQWRNCRYQVFVPGCPADSGWAREGSATPVTLQHYPSRFGPDWPFGPTTYGREDWAGQEPVRTSPRVAIRVVKTISITRPSG